MRTKDARFYRIKAGFSDLIERCGGQKRAGGLIGVSQQMMSKIEDREDSAMLSLDAKAVLETDCGAPVVTQIEAEMLGYQLVPAEPRLARKDGTPLDGHAGIMAEVADFCAAFSRAWSDRKYSRSDARETGRELRQLREEIERMERINAAIEAGEEPA